MLHQPQDVLGRADGVVAAWPCAGSAKPNACQVCAVSLPHSVFLEFGNAGDPHRKRTLTVVGVLIGVAHRFGRSHCRTAGSRSLCTTAPSAPPICLCRCSGCSDHDRCPLLCTSVTFGQDEIWADFSTALGPVLKVMVPVCSW